MNGSRFSKLEFKNGQVYTFDKYLFRGIIIFFFLLFLALFFFDRNSYYFNVSCPEKTINSFCENPYYNQQFIKVNYALGFYEKDFEIPPEIREVEFFPAGFSYGNPTPKIYNFFIPAFFLFLALGFVYNHFVYNKSFSFKKFKDEVINDELPK